MWFISIIIAVILGAMFYINLSHINKVKRQDTDKLDVIAIVDLDRRHLLWKDGDILAPLDEVSFDKVMQVFSSSPAIQAIWSDKKKILIRGDPFAWGIKPFVDVLKEKWLMR